MTKTKKQKDEKLLTEPLSKKANDNSLLVAVMQNTIYFNIFDCVL